MDKFKTYTILLSITVVVLLMIIIGRKDTYVCYDGTEEKVASKCPSVPPLTVTQKTADSAITTYVASYARSRPGVISSVINVYRVNNSWHSDVTFSNSKTGEFNQLTFNIDGKTSTITCVTGCEYMNNTNTTDSENTAN